MQNTPKASPGKVLGAAALAGTVGAVVGATAIVLSDEKRRKQVVGALQDLKKQGNTMIEKVVDTSQKLQKQAQDEAIHMKKVVGTEKKESLQSKK